LLIVSLQLIITDLPTPRHTVEDSHRISGKETKADIIWVKFITRKGKGRGKEVCKKGEIKCNFPSSENIGKVLSNLYEYSHREFRNDRSDVRWLA
jgi:hypothetical protein